MRIAFSLVCHEQMDVVVDQVENLHRFCPTALIGLHTAQRFTDFDIGQLPAYAWVNPQRLFTDNYWSSAQAHFSNFRELALLDQFDYVCLMASNELLVRSGLEKYLSQYDWGSDLHVVSRERAWRESRVAFRCPKWLGLLKAIGHSTDHFYASPWEGSFFRNSVFSVMEQLYAAHYHYEPVNYVLDEMLYATLGDRLLGHAGRGLRYCYTTVPENRDVERQEILDVAAGKHPNYYAVKRVPRVPNHPLRQFVKELT